MSQSPEDAPYEEEEEDLREVRILEEEVRLERIGREGKRIGLGGRKGGWKQEQKLKDLALAASAIKALLSILQ